MNVIYTYDIFSAQKYGGISRYFFELIKRISCGEVNIRVFAGLYINEYIKSLPIIRGVKVPSIKHTVIIRERINELFQGVMLQGCDSEIIVHQTYYHRSTPKKKVKCVVTVYDMIHELFPKYFPASDKTSDLKRQCCKRADKIIAVSKSTKKDLVSLFGVDPERIIVIYLGSSLNDNVPDSNADVFPEPYLLYVGGRGGYKNFDSVLQAFSQSNALKDNFHLICFGGGSFDVSEKIKLKRLGVAGHVHQVTGNDELLVSYYRNASTFILPSLYEGFGIPLLEAMSLSCPVICSKSSSIPEVVGDAGIYFEPNSISSIQNALEDTLFNESLLADMKKRGVQRASIFSWDKCASETLSVYRSLLS